jgi:hypothetical protein
MNTIHEEEEILVDNGNVGLKLEQACKPIIRSKKEKGVIT